MDPVIVTAEDSTTAHLSTLAITGATVALTTLIAALLLLIGAGVVLMTRKRKATTV